jgi:hypothetical protein
MKYLCATLVIVFVFLVELTSGYGQGLNKKFPTKHGFTIYLDDSWIEIPKEVIESLIRETEKIQGKSIKWDYGYQSTEDKEWFSDHYILVAVSENGKVSKEGFNKYGKSAEELNTEISGANHNQMKFIENYLDINSKRLHMVTKFNVANKGRVACVSSIIFTEKGYFEIGGYTNERDSSDYIPFYKDVIGSIEIGPSYRYKSERSNYLQIWLKKELPHLFNYLVAGILCFGVYAIYSKHRNRKKKEG